MKFTGVLINPISIRSRFKVPYLVPVSRQNVCQGYPEHGGRQEHHRAQEQGISKGFKIISVLEEFQVIFYAPAVGSGDFEAFQHQN
jgi:hypothetical protein